MSPSADLPLALTQPDLDKNSTYQEAKPLPDIRGSGELGLGWLCDKTEPKLTKVGSTHFHYHADIAGLLAHGVVQYLGVVKINDKVVANLNYYWNGSEEYHDFTIDTDGGNTTVQTSMRVYFGTETQTADSILNAFHSGQTHPAYRGQAYVVFQNLYGGDGSFRVPNVSVYFQTACQFTYDSFDYGDTPFPQGVNVVNVLHHWVTHPRAGLGLDEDVAFDMADMGLKYIAYNTQADDEYGEAQRGYVSPQLTKQRKAKDWIKELLSYFDGFITLKNGKLNLDWFPHQAITESDPSEYTTIYQADLADKPDINLPVWEDTISAVAIDYINIEKYSRKSSLVISSTHGKAVLGETRTERLTRDWFWYTNQVQSFGEKYIAAKGLPLFSGTLPIKRDRAINPDNVNVEAERQGAPFLPGHIFRLNYAPYGTNVLCRITEINPRGHVYQVGFVQERGTYPEDYVPTPDEIPELTLPTPTALADWALVNLPPELTGAYKNYIGILAERFTKAISSWDITFNDNDTWSTETAYLSEQVSFAARFEIQEDVALEAGPTTFEILGDTGNVDMTEIMESLDAKQAENNELLLFMGGEVMSCEANSLLGAANYDLTAYRGRYGTTIAAHTTNDVCWIIKRADLVQWFHEKFDQVYTAGAYDSGLATKYYKIRSNNIYQQGSWSTSQSFQIADQNPAVPTGLTLAAGVKKISVSFTRAANVDLKFTLLQWDTSPDFDNYPQSIELPSPLESYEITRAIHLGTDAELLPGVTYYVRARSYDNTGNLSAFTSNASAVAFIDPVNVPDFTRHGYVGGTSDADYRLNWTGSTATDGVLYLNGNYLQDTAGNVYPIEQKYTPTHIKDAITGAHYFAYFPTALSTTHASGSWPNQHFAIVELLGTVTTPLSWVVVDLNGDTYNIPDSAGAVIIGYVEKSDESTGLEKFVPFVKSVLKPLEVELEFPSLTAMKAYPAAKWATVPTGAPVRVKDLPKMYYDPASSATVDDGSVHDLDTGAGRVLVDFVKLGYVDPRAFGAGGDDDFNSPANDDSDAIEAATIYASANNLPVIFGGGVYRITRQILKDSDEKPLVKTFTWKSRFNEKQNQFVEENPGDLSKIRTCIVFDAVTDAEWLFRCLDYGAGDSGNYYYGPYEIDGFIFKMTQGNGFQFGGFDDNTSYDADSNAPFCFGVRIRNSYFSGATGCIALDGSQELWTRTTEQTFIELVRGYECELENLSVRGGSHQIKYKNCDNLKVDRIRSQQGFFALLGLSNAAVPATISNFQFEGFHGVGFYAEDAKFLNCRFENGYGSPYSVDRYLATESATDVQASISAAGQYINLTGLGSNEPSDFFEPYMAATIDDGSREYLVLITVVDDANDRLEFANYDSYSRFDAAITNADIYRHVGTLGILGEDQCCLTDCNGGFNNNDSTSIDDNPHFIAVPGKQPHKISGYSIGLGDNIKYSNRIAVAAHSYGKQFDLYGGLSYVDSSPHIAPDADHPLVSFSGMAIHQDLSNARSEFVTNPQLGQDEWLITPKNHICVDNNATRTYFEQVDGVWCWRKHASINIDLAPQLPEFPEGPGIYEVEVKARAVAGSSTTNIRIRNSTPTSNDIISSAAIDTTWRLYRGIIIDPLALDEGASRKFLEVAGPAAMYVQYIRFRKLSTPTDIYQDEFVLKHRSDSASNSVVALAVGDTFDVEETTPTFQITYNSVAYVDTEQVTFASSPTSFDTDSGAGVLWNTKRKFTPGVPGWLYVQLDFNDAQPVVIFARVLRIGSTWYLQNQYKYELGSVTGTDPLSINSSTGEITIEEDADPTARTNCQYIFSIDREKAERVFEYFN